MEVVYAKTDAANNWYHARQAILWPLWHPSWPNKWKEREFLNAEPIPPDVKDNRWYPFATQVGEQEAKVVYFHTPGPRSTNKRMAFRRLEEANLGLETIIGEDDPNAQAFGHWDGSMTTTIFCPLTGRPETRK